MNAVCHAKNETHSSAKACHVGLRIAVRQQFLDMHHKFPDPDIFAFDTSSVPQARAAVVRNGYGDEGPALDCSNSVCVSRCRRLGRGSVLQRRRVAKLYERRALSDPRRVRYKTQKCLGLEGCNL